MSYEEITLSGFMKEMKEVSSGPHSRKFCFVLGAGASKESGIKSGQELVDIWEEDLLERNKDSHQKWKKELGITGENKYEFYSQYYERRFKKAIDGYNYLEKIMESAKPSLGYVMLSYILTHTKHNVVITTNFDHLLENAVNYYENTIPLVIGHESLAHYITKQITRPMIIKIHRDLLLDPKNRTTEINVLHESWKRALDTVFSEYYPIFIGYAGNDHSLMDYLTNSSDIFAEGKDVFPYWMLYKNDKMSDTVMQFLDRSEGYLIKHSGFDEVMYFLGDIFAYRLPSKEEFMEDAEKRYKLLSDSIDKFTENLSPGSETERKGEEASESDTDTDLNFQQAIQNITSQTELQNRFREAVTLVNNGKYDKAIEYFRELIEKDTENARYYYWLGRVLHKMERYEEAQKEKEKAVKLEPGNAGYHDSLSTTLHVMGRYEEALEESQRAVELEPGNASYHDSLGVTLHEMGHYEEALEENQRAVELEPGNVRYHHNLGVALNDVGRYEEALEENQRAVKLEPGNARYHDSLGVTLHNVGRYEEALEEKQRAVELEPGNAEYHAILGVTLHELGRYEEALEESQRAVELEPGNAEYHAILDVTLHELGRYEEAKKEKEKAVARESLFIESDPRKG